jgi:hypothetical protein
MSLRRWRMFAAIIALACSLPLAVRASPLDGDGYITNWPGMLIPEFNGTPIPGAPTSTVSSMLGSALTPAQFCAALKSAVLAVGGSQIKSWDSCSVPSTFELRGKMLGTNTLGLKVLFSNVAFSFDASAATNPKMSVTANIEIDFGLAFDDAVDGSVTSTTTPLSATPASVKITNVTVSTHNVLASTLADITSAFGGTTSLQNIANQLASQQGQVNALTTEIDSTVDALNPGLHKDASLLQLAIIIGKVKPADPNSNAFFYLSVSIDANQMLDVDFQRTGGSPPTPNNCVMGSIGYAIVTAKCFTVTASGAVTFDQLDQMMLFRLDPAQSTPTQPVYDLADDGISNSWDLPAPRFAIPFLEDSYFQSVPNPPASATYQVCAQNLFGRACGPNLTVTLNLKVPPASPGGAPQCGPNSHPYKACQAILLNGSATHASTSPTPPR